LNQLRNRPGAACASETEDKKMIDNVLLLMSPLVFNDFDDPMIQSFNRILCNFFYHRQSVK